MTARAISPKADATAISPCSSWSVGIFPKSLTISARILIPAARAMIPRPVETPNFPNFPASIIPEISSIKPPIARSPCLSWSTGISPSCFRGLTSNRIPSANIEMPIPPLIRPLVCPSIILDTATSSPIRIPIATKPVLTCSGSISDIFFIAPARINIATETPIMANAILPSLLFFPPILSMAPIIAASSPIMAPIPTRAEDNLSGSIMERTSADAAKIPTAMAIFWIAPALMEPCMAARSVLSVLRVRCTSRMRFPPNALFIKLLRNVPPFPSVSIDIVSVILPIDRRSAPTAPVLKTSKKLLSPLSPPKARPRPSPIAFATPLIKSPSVLKMFFTVSPTEDKPLNFSLSSSIFSPSLENRFSTLSPPLVRLSQRVVNHSHTLLILDSKKSSVPETTFNSPNDAIFSTTFPRTDASFSDAFCINCVLSRKLESVSTCLPSLPNKETNAFPTRPTNGASGFKTVRTPFIKLLTIFKTDAKPKPILCKDNIVSMSILFTFDVKRLKASVALTSVSTVIGGIIALNAFFTVPITLLKA